MRIVVGGVGLVTALGVGVAENLTAIRQGRSGIVAEPALLKTSHRLPVGELAMSNEALQIRLGLPEAATLSRTALLGMLAVQEALADARVPEGLRIGLV